MISAHDQYLEKRADRHHLRNATPPDRATCGAMCPGGFNPRLPPSPGHPVPRRWKPSAETADGLTSEIRWSPNPPSNRPSPYSAKSARSQQEGQLTSNGPAHRIQVRRFEIAADVLRRAKSLDKETLRMPWPTPIWTPGRPREIHAQNLHHAGRGRPVVMGRRIPVI
jgi:hypothetical protein